MGSSGVGLVGAVDCIVSHLVIKYGVEAKQAGGAAAVKFFKAQSFIKIPPWALYPVPLSIVPVLLDAPRGREVNGGSV